MISVRNSRQTGRVAASIGGLAVALTLGGCAQGQWSRAETSTAEIESNLAECAAFERANARTVLVPQTFKSRDGSSVTYFFPQQYPTPDRDRDACMRQRGFVREAPKS